MTSPNSSPSPALFVARMAGDSMRNAGIRNGDLLIIDRARHAVDGDIVVAVLNGQLAVKRLSVQGDGAILRAENPQYPDYRAKDGSWPDIWGVVTDDVHPFVPSSPLSRLTASANASAPSTWAPAC